MVGRGKPFHDRSISVYAGLKGKNARHRMMVEKNLAVFCLKVFKAEQGNHIWMTGCHENAWQ